jgi:glycosyltransferase involved in cell wall biosynthesis
MKRYSFADAFLLPRPFRPYSKAGFPSKLGEYLLAGKPVISTATGDIPLYLEDGVSAYLVENDSSEAFSDKILRCVKDSDSLKVGMMGREVALDSFSIEATSKRLRSFFMELGYYE